MAKLRYESHIAGTWLLVDCETGEDILYQTDWEYPGLASLFGHGICPHGRSDGTVACSQCGKTATDFISEAIDFLDSHEGDVVTVSDSPFDYVE